MLDRRTFLQLPLLGMPLYLVAELTAQTIQKTSTMKVKMPVVVSTWDSGLRANAAGWQILDRGGSARDAVEAAARSAEDEQSCCVGLGAYPDRDGKVTLDASIMDGNGDCGAVSFLDRIRHPISVARKLMETTPHILLSGEGAREFAVANGFKLESGDLSPDSEKEWKKWLEKSNYKPIVNVENLKESGLTSQFAPHFFDDGSPNHDTIGTIAIDATAGLSGAVTTSGLAFKMRGRVGDSPIIGAGLFVDNEVGAATSSGVGEEVIRICGSHTVVEQMRLGRSPEKACREAVRRIVKRDPKKAKDFQVGFLALSKRGEIGAFAVQKGFTYAITNKQFPYGKVFESNSHFA
ncbi:MAG: N(4)-(beta-N-acetylglucosaminyl)-L-asparaginase [Pyrinomonadaceae bacterium]